MWGVQGEFKPMELAGLNRIGERGGIESGGGSGQYRHQYEPFFRPMPSSCLTSLFQLAAGKDRIANQMFPKGNFRERPFSSFLPEVLVPAKVWQEPSVKLARTAR